MCRCSWLAGLIVPGTVDKAHLASSQDLLPTLCDYAGIVSPPGVTGVSLRPV